MEWRFIGPPDRADMPIHLLDGYAGQKFEITWAEGKLSNGVSLDWTAAGSSTPFARHRGTSCCTMLFHSSARSASDGLSHRHSRQESEALEPGEGSVSRRRIH